MTNRKNGWFVILVAALVVVGGCATPAPSDRSGSTRKIASDSPVPTAITDAKLSSPATVSAIRPAKVDAPKSVDAVQSVAGWQGLFDGKTLNGWKITEFGGRGDVGVKDGLLMIHMGAMLTGVAWTNEIPKTDYEIELEAMKVEGSDFFCGLTFPVGNAFCSFIVGGWGGGVVGLSSIDGYDASENETTKYMPFDKDRWYRIRLRVMTTRIEAWIDNDKLVDQSIVGRKISLRPGEIEYSVPFGLATWQTTAALRNIKVRPLSGGNAPTAPK